MGIRVKLIGFLLLFGFGILGALIWTNQYLLHKTLVAYVDGRDQQRLERLKANIEVYLTHFVGAQQAPLRGLSPTTWAQLVHLSNRFDLRQTPPAFMPFLFAREFILQGPQKDPFFERVSLSQLRGPMVYGTSSAKTSIRMTVLWQGQPLAELRYHPLEELIEKADIEFAQTQTQLMALGSVLIVLLGLILLWPLAQHFLHPMRQLTQAMRRVASGDLTQRLHVERQDELGQLQRDFNHLAQSLESAQLSRNQWIADISHELRTPLTVMRGSLEALVDGVRPMTTDNLAPLSHEVALLSRLIEDLYQLSLSDVGALQYQMKPLCLSELVTLSLAQHRDKREAKGLSLLTEGLNNPESEAWIVGDRARLLQLLSNLLNNALDYTDAYRPDGQPGVVSVALQSSEGKVRLVIEDSAPGVSDEELPRLSERFYRTDPSRNRRTGGAGLGLSMVSQIALAHQASFALSSSPLGGLRVTLTFAISRASPLE